MTAREPAGTTRLPNGAIQYDCCGETGGTPRIRHYNPNDAPNAWEVYHCPHCHAYQGEREINPECLDDAWDEESARAFNEVGT